MKNLAGTCHLYVEIKHMPSYFQFCPMSTLHLITLLRVHVYMTQSTSHPKQRSYSIPAHYYLAFILHSLPSTRCSWRWQTSPPVLPPGVQDKTYTSSSILVHVLYYVKNMTSSTKWEIHNVLQCSQRTKPQPQVIYRENLAM